MIATVLDELFLARLSRRMSVPRALTYLGVVLLIALLPVRQSLAKQGLLADDNHGMVSLALAIDRAFCGKSSSLPADIRLGTELQRRPELSHVPIADIIARRSGSVERYCATVNSPVLNNENSLMLTEAWLLRVWPRLSLANISNIMLGLQISMIAVLCFALLRAGAGVFMCAGVMQLGIDLLLKVHVFFELSGYPFLVCLVALVAGCCVLSIVRGSPRFFVWCSPALGVITAYAVNMRTSYLPMFIGFFAASLGGLLLADRSNERRMRVALAASVLFASAYLAFQVGLIPSDRGASDANNSYHPIAHPLVLSLAVPANPLAAREGIEWDDRRGLALAQRVNPSVGYLRPGYEAALFAYYRGLWRRYPGEMLAIYVQKLRIAGPRIVEAAASVEWGWAGTGVLRVLGKLQSGFWFFGVFLIAAGASFAGYVRMRAPLLMAICVVAVGAMFLLVEAAIIMPSFVLNYHQSLLFMAGVLTLCGAQCVVSLGVDVATLVMSESAEAARRSARSVSENTIVDSGERWLAGADRSAFHDSPALLQDVFGPLLRVDDIQKAVVADIEAGVGRFTTVFLASGAAKVIAVEPSRAFEVLRHNTAAYNGQVECVRSDAKDFAPVVPVDFVFSCGLLHHIPDPRAAVAAMHRALKPGGHVGIWLYGREGTDGYRTILTMLRSVSRQMSKSSLEDYVSVVYVPAFIYMWLCHMLPLPMRSYFVGVFRNLTPDQRRLTIYDQLRPAYVKYYWQQEVRALLEDAGFVDVQVFHRHGYSWAAVGAKA